MIRVCIGCGEPVLLDSLHGCGDEPCRSYRADTARNKWIIPMGRSLARFVRNAEVDRLVKEAKMATRHAHPCVTNADPDAEDCGCDVRRSRTAVDILAAMAKGER